MILWGKCHTLEFEIKDNTKIINIEIKSFTIQITCYLNIYILVDQEIYCVPVLETSSIVNTSKYKDFQNKDILCIYASYRRQ
jgi:hypothetical protein